MLQRDYIQRLIREFMAALERMLEKKEVEVRREKIKELYNQYVGPYAFYSIATIEDVMKAMAGIEDEEKRLSKMDMLAELYYHEADTVGQPARDELLNKAFMLFDYVEPTEIRSPLSAATKWHKSNRKWEMNSTNDMTVGSPLRAIIKFAIPLILGYILQQMYLIIDAAIVGRWIGVSLWLVPALAWTGVCFGDPVAWVMADLFLIPAFLWLYKHLKKEQVR